MRQTQKKTEPIKQKASSVSKKQVKSLKTQKKSKSEAKSPVAEMKIATKSPTITDAAPSSSTPNLPTTSHSLSPHHALQSVKKRSLADRAAGGNGWVKRTLDEQAGFEEMAEGFRKAPGRPRRDPNGTAKVVSFRFSETEMQHIQSRAAEKGFDSWREYVRAALLENMRR